MSFDPQTLGRLGITEEQVELMDVAESFCRDESDIAKVRAQLDDARGFSQDDWTAIADLGWLGIAIPEEFGGVGLSLAEVVPVVEQMGRRMMALPFLSTTLVAQAILKGGTETQKTTYLPKIAEGSVATLALSELNGSFDLNDIETQAQRTTNGFKVSGQKILVQNLDAAELVLLSAKFEGQTALFILDASLIPDSARRREKLIDETKRSCEVSFDGLILPESALLDLNQSTATLSHIDLCGNLLGSAELVGATQTCLDYTLDYLRTRKQFGKLIGSYQALKHPIVDAYIGYEKARSLLYAAAHSFEQQGKGEVATRMAKVAAGRALSFSADRSIQFHGGFGFTYDCDAQLYRRRAIFHDGQFGDTRWQKKQLARLLFN
ncbi:isovaleryl-CoA dehydrogenase [Litorimonas cladophorae]|uniref:Isovaleryl-CoA dehydrogenase n=1 Tax=Litorimonas cladophorae TaxID=1220491 RepID=A0A918NIZ3_9PROT|nr:acyl-CoA dehydrogenase family protein [Litorimonas cladophorae]GGX73779.1 isovaleryl-CoA dehydrogenase [Litorimonas cladophorae]